MVIIWTGFLVELLILSILKLWVSGSEFLGIIIILLNIILLYFGLSKYEIKFRLVFYSGFILRLGCMFWDLYARQVFVLPNSGFDSEKFFYYADVVSKKLYLIKSTIYGGVYSKSLGLLFKFIGTNRMIAQYINVLLGLTIILFVYKILKLLDIDTKIVMFSVCVVSFFPNAIIMSAILLRENFNTALTLISFYFFVKWYKMGKIVNVIASVLLLVLASSFHAGVIGILVGYILMYMCYKPDKKSFTIDRNTIIVFACFAIFAFLLMTRMSDIVLEKFSWINNFKDIYKAVNRSAGGSAYLPNLKINSLWELALYTPVRMIYFLFSPLPMNWRGISDFIAFAVDSLVYLLLLSYSFYNIKNCGETKYLVGAVTIMLLIVSMLFGLGVFTAGTAMRHRHKIFPIILVLFSIVANMTHTIENIKNK